MVDPKAPSYTPVIAVFGVAASLAVAIDWIAGAAPIGLVGAGRFFAVAMCLLAMLKLQNVERFSSMFWL